MRWDGHTSITQYWRFSGVSNIIRHCLVAHCLDSDLKQEVPSLQHSLVAGIRAILSQHLSQTLTNCHGIIDD